MSQLALFEVGGDDRPLPEIIASGGRDWSAFPLAHHDVEGVRYYAVQDWIAGVSEAVEPRKVWNKLKKRLADNNIQLSPSPLQLPYVARDGKKYKVEHVTAEALYQITQRMDADSGIRDRILRYLAKAGVTLDEYRRDPSKAIDAGIARYKALGHDDQWINQRLQGIVARNVLTQALADVVKDANYGAATNDVYVRLYEHTAKQLRKALGIPEKASLRDHLPMLALTYLQSAEIIIAEQLRNAGEALSWEDAERIILEFAEMIGEQVRQLSERLGRNIATNAPLLKGGGK